LAAHASGRQSRHSIIDLFQRPELEPHTAPRFGLGDPPRQVYAHLLPNV
jgi:hypothetical protein